MSHSLYQWLSYLNSLVSNNSPTPTVLSSDETQYQTHGRSRSSSIFTDKDGRVYVTGEELGRGRGGVVRRLQTDEPHQGPELVVKKNLDGHQIKATNLWSSKGFLCLAYPELAEYIHVFDHEDPSKIRLVMPKLGEKTLASVLAEQGTRSLNNRYAHCVQALDELIRLRQLGLFHNDGHAGNILFDKEGKCYLIDGERYQKIDINDTEAFQGACCASKDLSYFKGREHSNLTPFFTGYRSLNWGDVYDNPIKHLPNHLTLGLNAKKDTITYHLVDLNGNPIKNTITRSDAEALLEPTDFQALCENIFNADGAMRFNDPLKDYLHLILEVTSKRGETVRDARTYMSDNFLKNIDAAPGLMRIREVFIEEMMLNHEKVRGLIQNVRGQLLDCVIAVLNERRIHPNLCGLLQQIESKLTAIDVDSLPFTYEIQRYQTEDVLHELIETMYQLECACLTTSPNSYTPRFLLKPPSATHQLSQPYFDTIRELLRRDSVHLPEVILPREAVLNGVGLDRRGDEYPLAP